jgi:GTPase
MQAIPPALRCVVRLNHVARIQVAIAPLTGGIATYPQPPSSLHYHHCYRNHRYRGIHTSIRRTLQHTAAVETASIPAVHNEVSSTVSEDSSDSTPTNPTDDYHLTPFTDSCALSLYAGSGGHGCVSFIREKYLEDGPPNGGDGGIGGSIYIQAVRGETSLHKLARRGIIKAGRGRNGRGKARGGERGEDVIITVPVGTVVREVWREDLMVAEEEEWGERQREREMIIAREKMEEKRRKREEMYQQRQRREREEREEESEDHFDNSESDADTKEEFSKRRPRKHYNDFPSDPAFSRPEDAQKFLLYPGLSSQKHKFVNLPSPPKPRRSPLATLEPASPINLDLSIPTPNPLLLVAGSMGGLGNPHFMTKDEPRPKYATRGSPGTKVSLQLELKLIADVGLVGLPNAGKSTLLRALTNSRARVGDWAFTTLQPNIGTVVLDDHKGRLKTNLLVMPSADGRTGQGEVRTNFTIADIPGLIEDAHLDRGLGLDFLRHIERAGVLAFVVDLSAGDAVKALSGLWKEVGEYEAKRDADIAADTQRVIEWSPLSSSSASYSGAEDGLVLDSASDETSSGLQARRRPLPPLALPPISSKPWFVVCTKADLPGTQENFKMLLRYLGNIESGEVEHPSRRKHGWKRSLKAVPVCAMKKEGVERVRDIVIELLSGRI